MILFLQDSFNKEIKYEEKCLTVTMYNSMVIQTGKEDKDGMLETFFIHELSLDLNSGHEHRNRLRYKS